ncbi:Na+/H+ antiporter NhaA [Rugosimonospora africana]|uniref:Na(+)/H(+) antiporter NhaA n=1 Tax=Rugosimonospora africana TaxID=556532 RepID=A0A8J3VQ70_9ACTN|nr:Na+/H+ antiporter NhaA [Rugosimonospora africana]GIH14830.1 Na(+)/H(+) antiporter NhaA [Rugosimonospora africana]
MSDQSVPGRPSPGPSARVNVPLPYLPPALKQFLADEAGSAALLLVAAVAALIWANTAGGEYERFWTTATSIKIGHWSTSLDVRHWVNDAAMAVFFLVVGLEISREATVGDLRNVRRVAVPACGAIGGLVLPALIYFAVEHHGAAAAGWGIPMSTDTAFLIGILALFGPRCPDQLRLFLLTLAIVDDIGAITVMAVFYTPRVHLAALIAAGCLVLVLIAVRWMRVWRLWPYVLTGIGLWIAVYASGVHPTLAGVLVGLLIPATVVESEQSERFRQFGRAVIERADPQRARLAASAARATVPANDRLQDALHPVSAFVVIPIFGLANAGVRLNGAVLRHAATSGVTIGIVVALLVGNAVGISVATGAALRTGLGDLPGRVRYGHLIGGAVLAGIGFTISLFVTDLAFHDVVLRDEAKIGVLTGSLLAAVFGSLLLRYLGERLPLCSLDEGPPPPLPTGPWRDPSLAAAG